MIHRPAAIALTAALAVCLLVAVLSALRTPVVAQGQEFSAPFVPGEILIAFKAQATAEQRTALREELAGVRQHTFRSGAEHWRLGPGETVEDAIPYLRSNELVRYVEPNYLVTLYEDFPDCVPTSDGQCPTDPNFPEQFAQTWG